MKMINKSKLEEIRRLLFDDDGYTRINNPHFDMIFEEAFKAGLNYVNNGVLDDVSQRSELLKAFLEWQQNKYSMPYDTKIEWQIKDFEAFNCG